MVKVLMGLKGSGKTKKIIELANEAVEDEQGDIVFIEATLKLIHDIHQKVRLIDGSQYDFNGYDFLKGYISGLYCANYDITHIFIDGLLKLVSKEYDSETDEFLKWCEEFGKNEDIQFTITMSADKEKASEKIKSYL